MLAMIEKPEHQLQEPQPVEDLQVPFVLDGQRPGGAVSPEQPRAAGVVVGSPPEFTQRDREIVEIVPPPTVVEVDRPHPIPRKQDVLLVEIAVDEPERLRPLAEFALRLPDQVDHGLDDRDRPRTALIPDDADNVRPNLAADVVSSPAREIRRG